MKTLNKLILTSLIGAGSFLGVGKGYGQDMLLDSIPERINIRIKMDDSLFNRLKEESNSFLNLMKEHSPEYFSKKVYSENLSINLNEKIYYVTKKNEEEGVRDLIKICNGAYEESWLYIPEKQIWYETGIYSDSESVEIYTSRIEKVLGENKDVKELIFYHIHPSGIGEPSLGDMRTLFYHNLDFPDYKIVSKIVAKNDLTEYSLNSKGKEKLKDSNFVRYLYDNVAPEYFDIKCTSIDSLDK